VGIRGTERGIAEIGITVPKRENCTNRQEEQQRRLVKWMNTPLKLAALGLPGIILVVTMATTGFTGAAAITAALAFR